MVTPSVEARNGNGIDRGKFTIPAGSAQSEVAVGFAPCPLDRTSADWDEPSLAGRSQRISVRGGPVRPVRGPQGSGIHEGMARGAVALKRTTAIELERTTAPHRHQPASPIQKSALSTKVRRATHGK